MTVNTKSVPNAGMYSLAKPSPSTGRTFSVRWLPGSGGGSCDQRSSRSAVASACLPADIQSVTYTSYTTNNSTTRPSVISTSPSVKITFWVWSPPPPAVRRRLPPTASINSVGASSPSTCSFAGACAEPPRADAPTLPAALTLPAAPAPVAGPAPTAGPAPAGAPAGVAEPWPTTPSTLVWSGSTFRPAWPGAAGGPARPAPPKGPAWRGGAGRLGGPIRPGRPAASDGPDWPTGLPWPTAPG